MFKNEEHTEPSPVHCACLNRGQAFAPEEIRDRSICVNGDIGEILERLGYPGGAKKQA